MQEPKDPAIKLFGKEIPVSSTGDSPVGAGGDAASPAMKSAESLREEEDEEELVGDGDDDDGGGDGYEEDAEQKKSVEKAADGSPESSEERPESEEESKGPKTSMDGVDPMTPAIEEESTKPRISETGMDAESDKPKSTAEKTLKKPDKILPCPRCNSMDTKFCYYNNYNVNQPRHFCRACQRYWTAGGTMRNVPVGAGRRKNKNAASRYRHITISEALQAARIDAPSCTQVPNLGTNGTVLTFGLDSPMSNSRSPVPNLAEKKKTLNGYRNRFHDFENGDDSSTCSTVTVSNSADEKILNLPQDKGIGNVNGLSTQIPCIPGVPWAPYPWSPAIPPPAFCPPGCPQMPFYPAAFWTCGVIPSAWNIPCLSTQTPFFNRNATSRGPNSPTLGKHPREFESLKQDASLEEPEPPKRPNGCVLVPKTLRIDDPSEAAKSSIWAALGIKAFEPKSTEGKCKEPETSPVLRANPAALSRSLNFHEST